MQKRRDFFRTLVERTGGGALLAALRPATARGGWFGFGKRKGWMRLGVLSEFSEGVPARVETSTWVSDGEENDEPMLAVFREKDRVYALSTRCTHMGCEVRWRKSDGLFHCPCHDSEFNRGGEKLRGPADGDLVWYETRVLPSGEVRVNNGKTVPPPETTTESTQ